MINGVEFAKLDEGERALVEWQYCPEGNFSNQLMELIAKADSHNKQLLYKGYPLHVRAYLNYAHTTGWWPDIQRRVLKPILYAVSANDQ